MHVIIADSSMFSARCTARIIQKINPAITVDIAVSFSSLNRKVIASQPDLVVIDPILRDCVSPLATLAALEKSSQDIPLVIFCSEPQETFSKIKQPFISKDDSLESIHTSFNEMFCEKLFDVSEDDEDTGFVKLSKRQKQLLVYIEKGHSNKEIAELIKISEHTVKVHFWRLFKRLDVNSRTKALASAKRRGLM